MFAFAIWDTQKKELFIARDRLGIKPLYYYRKKGLFIFASEIKAILEDKEIKKKIDLEALNNYMAFKHVSGDRTIYQDIWKLEPGRYLLLKGNKLSIEQYWDLAFKEQPISLKHTVSTIRSLLEDSVKLRMIADVPVGVFLSGGLDSSMLTALMSKQTDTVSTFSINFEGREDNEGKYAQQVADQFHTDHHELWVGPKDVQALLPKIAYQLDEPMNDLASIPSYLLARFAKPKITVALTGGGADELFVGYRQALLNHYAPYLRDLAKIVPLPRSTFGKGTKALVNLSIKDSPSRAASWTKIFPDAERKKLFTSKVRKAIDVADLGINQRYRDQMKGLSALNQNLYFESKTWLPEILLMEADKMSMMASLEMRVPFLDHRLVEFMGTVPTRLKLRGIRTKHLLKLAARPYLPRGIIHRKKQGFALPILDWLKEDLKSYCDNLLADQAISSYLNKAYVQKLFDRYARGREDAGFQMANLIMFSLWHKLYIREEKISAL